MVSPGQLTIILNTRNLSIGLTPSKEATMKRATKRVAVATVSALFGLAPGIGSACEYTDSMASTLPREEVAATQVPAATVAPKVKVSATKTAKQAAKESKANTKLAAATNIATTK
jgi:hypothetical protein